jgi:hypothetical protein
MTNPIMRWFDSAHLPPHLQIIVASYRALAETVTLNTADGPEKSTALRKLLESKDAAVRARIEYIEQQKQGTT